MVTTVLAGVLALALAQQTDTTFAVGATPRIEVEAFGGEIIVGVWDRNAIRVQADHSSRSRVEIDRRGSNISIEAESRFGAPAVVDYRLTVPKGASIDASGVNVAIRISGVEGDIEAETVNGGVHIEGGRGRIYAAAVSGGVVISGAHGRIRAEAVSGGVRISNSGGDIVAESVSGGVELRNMDATSVEAETVSGRVLYAGPVRAGGRYVLVSHSGEVVLAVPDELNATVSVATMSGDLDSSFPLPVRSMRAGDRHTFTLGTGGAKVELETFSGNVRLRRLSEIR